MTLSFFFFLRFLLFFNYVYLCVGVPVHVPIEAIGVGVPKGEDIDSCEMANVGTDNQTQVL